ncbi:MAG: cell division protein ZapA [Lachnospiraceae bacterium]|jgi:cell division protein ZapA
MASKNDVQVIIDGRVLTLSANESEEYMQKIALYINNKLEELRAMSGYKRMSSDMQRIMLELNMADDYFKAKKRIAELESDLDERDKSEYDLKHKLVANQLDIESATKEIESLKDEITELQKQIVRLEASSSRK